MLDGISQCQLTVGSSFVRIDASDVEGLTIFDWLVGGVPELFYEASQVTELPSLRRAELLLDSATLDPATRTIAAQLHESRGSFALTASFTLSDAPGASTLDETLTLQSMVDGASERLYLVRDFDLGDSPTDGSIGSNAAGTLVTQTDGATTATIAVVSGPAPDAFQVSACCGLDDLSSGESVFSLDGAKSVPGPADFQSAASWDRSLNKNESFTVALRERVPEPIAALADATALLALLVLARARRG